MWDIHCVLRGVMPHGQAQISNATRPCGAQQQKYILLPVALHCISLQRLHIVKLVACLFACFNLVVTPDSQLFLFSIVFINSVNVIRSQLVEY